MQTRQSMEEFMKPTTLAAPALFAALLSACSSSAPADTPAGSASANNACINTTEITKQTIVSDQEIRFELRNGEVWSNTLPRVCPGLKFEQGFSWTVSGNLVCSNQQSIRVKDEGTTCLLGAFTRLPEQPKS
jgi:hypothetical protein